MTYTLLSLCNLAFSYPGYEKNFKLNVNNFDIHTGDSIGVIGPNGSGKSTLLKILCGTFPVPKNAKILNCNVFGMLKFPRIIYDTTGRELAKFTLLSYGNYSSKQLNTKLDEVKSASGLNNWFDLPVNTYSDGMISRLLLPCILLQDRADLLVVDEAIFSVGDHEFIERATSDFKSYAQQSKAFVFASHNLDFLRDNCNRFLVLDNGHTHQMTDAEKAIKLHLKLCQKSSF